MAARSRIFMSLYQAHGLEENGLSLWWHHGSSRPYWSVQPNEPSDRLVAKPSYFIRMIEALPIHERGVPTEIAPVKTRTVHEPKPPVVVFSTDIEFSFLLYEDETYV